MLTQTSLFIGQLVGTSRGCRVSAADTHPQRLHTGSTRYPPCLHSLPICTHDVDRPVQAVPTVSPREANAPVSPSCVASESMPTSRPVRPSRNSQKAAAGNTASPTSSSVQRQCVPDHHGPAADRANPKVSPRDADAQQQGHPAKQQLPNGEPGLAAVFTRSSATAADRVASWSWFATAEPTGWLR